MHSRPFRSRPDLNFSIRWNRHTRKGRARSLHVSSVQPYTELHEASIEYPISIIITIIMSKRPSRIWNTVLTQILGRYIFEEYNTTRYLNYTKFQYQVRGFWLLENNREKVHKIQVSCRHFSYDRRRFLRFGGLGSAEVEARCGLFEVLALRSLRGVGDD
jgi:hypothetical protein